MVKTKETEILSASERLYLDLYAACTKYLRTGKISATDYRSYLFPMIFFKRISDVYDEEYEDALKQINKVEYAKEDFNHRFIIPDGCHWKDLREQSTNVGEYFYDCMLKVEEANPNTLKGLFTNYDTEWKNINKVTDELMHSLIEHFSAIPLGNKDYESDIIGQAYEYLIKKFADTTKKKAGEYYTPREVIRLMVSVLKPKSGETIYDPACGTGGMLLECMRYMNDPVMTLGCLYGQDSKAATASMCKINLFLHGADDFHMGIGSTLTDPKYHDGSKLKRFSVVIANPPFSLKEWGSAKWEHDPYGRNIYGTPSNNNADFAWIQHMICSMDEESGRMGVVLPDGVAFKKEYKEMRKKLIEDNKLWCVIKMADNLFYGTTLSPMIYFFKNKKTDDKVRFVDASEIYLKRRAQNILSQENIDQIYSLITGTDDVEELAVTVTNEEIAIQEYELNVNKYVIKKYVDTTRPLAEVTSDLIDNINESRALEQSIKKQLEEGGY